MDLTGISYRFFASKRLFILFFGVISIITVSLAISSFKWWFGVDNDPLLYAAFVTDKFGLLPYRDFFYMHMPGVQAYYLIIGKIFGYSYAGFRFADIIFTSVVFISNMILLRKLNWKIAWSASILFCLVYFIGKNHFAMQRDYVLLLPLIIAIIITIYFAGIRSEYKLAIGGFLCALSILIKPQEVLIYPVILLFQLWYFDDTFYKPPILKKLITPVLFSLAGFTFVFITVFIYLMITGSFDDFRDTFIYFHPLYRKLYNPAGNELIPLPETLSYYLNEHLKFGGQRLLFIPALTGIYIVLFRSKFMHGQKKIVYLFIALAVMFNVNVILAGKYFADHWIQFSYCMIILACLCFVVPSGLKKHNAGKVIPLITIYAVIVIRLFQNSSSITSELTFESYKDPVRERIEDAAQYLKNNLSPGEKVLTLDMLGYSLASLMLADARQATYHVPPWYLNIPGLSAEDYIKNKKSHFLQQVESEKPRFIIDFDGFKWFNEFQNILDSEYVKIPDKDYLVYSRKVVKAAAP